MIDGAESNTNGLRSKRIDENQISWTWRSKIECPSPGISPGETLFTFSFLSATSDRFRSPFNTHRTMQVKIIVPHICLIYLYCSQVFNIWYILHNILLRHCQDDLDIIKNELTICLALVINNKWNQKCALKDRWFLVNAWKVYIICQVKNLMIIY